MIGAYALALALVFVPAIAEAECAWVLWTEVFQPGMGSSEHDVDSAHPSLAACDSALFAFVTALKKDGYTVSGGTKGTHVAIGSKGTTRRVYRCLPDTVDPRGPKGGK